GPDAPLGAHAYRREVIRERSTTRGDEAEVERLRRTTHLMRSLLIVVGTALMTALAAAPVLAVSTPGSGEPPRGWPGNAAATEYSLAVTYICGGALLFDHAHHMGSRADALAVSRDIRASTARRLARVTALSVPRELHRT